MKKRIYFSFLKLLLPSALLLAALLSLLYYNAARKQEMAAVRDRAVLVCDLLNSGSNTSFNDYLSPDPQSSRITVIAPDGKVLSDNKADASALENHGGREEVIAALQSGSGESLRYSKTLRADTYYYAKKLDDGNVLRVSKTIGSIAGVFVMSLPAVAVTTLLILLAANHAARRLTKQIVEPLEHADFENGSAVYDELLPYAGKIQGQKQEIAGQLDALRERADTIEKITGNMREGILLTGKDGEVLTANKSAREIFGDMENKSILHIGRDAGFGREMRRCLDGENAELVLKRDDRVYHVFLSPVQSGGAVILLWDTTEKHRAEKQRREFSANVSHELKTPLTTISALSEMIAGGMAKDGDISGFAARITEQCGRLLVIIDDIIKLSEFDEGGVRRENTVFSLLELAENVASSFRGNPAGVEIRTTGESFKISANRHMLDELLYNLIDNSVKYNREGGLVTVDISREGGFAKIRVSDTGIGIPSEHLERVFERFYRVDKSRSKKTGGTGLGLSIVKHIAEYHEGRVELTSAGDGGTTVTCYITGVI